MNIKTILPVSILIIVLFLGGYYYTTKSNDKLIEQTTLQKKVQTPEKTDSGDFVSVLVDFKVKTEKDKYTITYPRGKFKTDEIKNEINKVLKFTDMSGANILSITGGAIFNESVYVDTTSECGLTNPSSAWCFRLTNDKEVKTVKIVIQKGKF